MKVFLGSASQRKIDVVKQVVRQLFPAIHFSVGGYAAISGVPETPYDEETFRGACNRAHDTKNHCSDGDYHIGLESGLVERYGHMYEEAWACVITKEGEEFFGYSSGLKVPDYVLRTMNEMSMEHSQVMEILEEKHGKLPNDTWGNYSGGQIIRSISLEEALRNAFVQIIAPSESFYKK